MSLSARLCQMSNVIFSIPGQYMQSPNITVGVPKRYFTPQKHTITKHVHIHFRTLHGWFAINDQWSIQFLKHWNGMKWICTINILSPTVYSHAAQKVGLNSFAPNSAPTETAFHHFQPYQPLHSEDSLVPPISHLWWARRRYGMVADLIWSRCRVNTKESGRSNWAAGGRKSQCSANAWWWWCRCLWLRYYSNSNLFASSESLLLVAFLRIKIHVAFR